MLEKAGMNLCRFRTISEELWNDSSTVKSGIEQIYYHYPIIYYPIYHLQGTDTHL